MGYLVSLRLLFVAALFLCAAAKREPYTLKNAHNYQEFPGSLLTGDIIMKSVYWEPDGKTGYFAGHFDASVDFGNGRVVVNSGGPGSNVTDTFLVKVRDDFTDGRQLAKFSRQSLTADVVELTGQICSAPSSDYIFLVGTAYSPTNQTYTLDFGNGATLPSAGAYHGNQSTAFLVRYSKSILRPQWARGQLPGESFSESTGVACSLDSITGDVLISGLYRSEFPAPRDTRFEGNGTVESLPLTNGLDPYVCRYRQDGLLVTCWGGRGPENEIADRSDPFFDEVTDVLTENNAPFDDLVLVLGYTQNPNITALASASLRLLGLTEGENNPFILRYNGLGVPTSVHQLNPLSDPARFGRLLSIAQDPVELFLWACGQAEGAGGGVWVVQLTAGLTPGSLVELQNFVIPTVGTGTAVCNTIRVNDRSQVVLGGATTAGLDWSGLVGGAEWTIPDVNGGWVAKLQDDLTVGFTAYVESTCATAAYCTEVFDVAIDDLLDIYTVGHFGVNSDFTSITPRGPYLTDSFTTNGAQYQANGFLGHYVAATVMYPVKADVVPLYDFVPVHWVGFDRDAFVTLEFRNQRDSGVLVTTAGGRDTFKNVVLHHMFPGPTVLTVNGTTTGTMYTTGRFILALP